MNPYIKRNWVNGMSPAINATNLNYMDQGIYNLYDQVNTPDNGVLPMTPTTSNQTVIDTVVDDIYSGVVDAEIGGATIVNVFDKNAGFSNVGLGLTESGDVYTGTTGANSTSNVIMLLPGEIGIRKTTSGTYTQSITTPVSLSGVTLTIGLVGNAQDAARSYTASELLKPSTQYTFYLKVRTLTANSAVFDLAITEGDTTSKIGNIEEALAYGLRSTERVEINTSGKNLYGGELVLGYYDANGNFQPEYFTATKDKEAVVPNSPYNIKFYNVSGTAATYISFYDKHKNFISEISGASVSELAVTTPANCHFIAAYTAKPFNGEGVLQINEGLAAIPQEAFKGSKMTVDCTNRQQFELSQTLNLAENEVINAYGYTWAIKRIVGRTVLDGTEDWLLDSTRTNTAIFYFLNDSAKDNNGKVYISEHFEAKQWGGVSGMLLSDTEGISGNSNGLCAISILKSKLTTVDAPGFKTWLTANNDTVIYQSAVTELIAFEDFSTYGIKVKGLLKCENDYTNFKYTADLIPEADLTYPRNLAACVNGLTQAMANAYNILTDNNQSIEELELDGLGKLSTFRDSKDAFGVWQEIIYKRKDSTAYKISILSGGAAPNYTTRTETYYEADGVTVLRTNVYTLTFSSGDLVSEVLQ